MSPTFAEKVALPDAPRLLALPSPTASGLSRLGCSVFPIRQLREGWVEAKRFHACVSSARLSHGAWGACLHLYQPEEYAEMALFTDQHGLAGFALNGNEVVSVFCHRQRPERRASRTLMAFATRLGGQCLNAFDTVLSKLYGECGFRTIARMAWNDRFAPKDWDYVAAGAFNGGRPDVVFMNYHSDMPEHRVATFEEGVRRQKLAIGIDRRSLCQ